MAENKWERFTEPENDWLPQVENLNALLNSGITLSTSFVEAGLTLIETLSTFVSATQEPWAVAIQFLLQQVQEVLNNFTHTGAYGLFVFPESINELEKYRGGFGQFKQTFLKSLHDYEDSQRPQIPDTGSMGGMFLLIRSEDISEWMSKLFTLFRFLQRTPPITMPAPVSLRIVPASFAGLPLDQNLTTWRDNPATSLRLEWSEPVIVNTFHDIYSMSKFYVERSKNPEGYIKLRERTPDSEKTPLDDNTTKEQRYVEPELDGEGEIISYWEPLMLSEGATNPNDFLLDSFDLVNRLNPLTGKYVYVIKDVPKGIENGYYYRVRAVPRNAEVVKVKIKTPNEDGSTREQDVYDIKIGNESILKSCPPSAPVLGFLPDLDENFDVQSAILNVFRAAYLLRFDTRVTTNDGANVSRGSNTLERSVDHIMKRFHEDSVVEYVDDEEQETIRFLADVGLYDSVVKTSDSDTNYITTYNEAYAMANMKGWYSNTLTLENVPYFGGVDEILVPTINSDDREKLRIAIEVLSRDQVRKAAKYITSNEALFEIFQEQYEVSGIPSFLVGTLDVEDIVRSDSTIRENVDNLLILLRGSLKLGTPPNWQSLRLLEDTFPDLSDWEKVLFDLLASLNNTFKTTLNNLEDSLLGIRQRLALINEILDALGAIIEIGEKFDWLRSNVDFLWIPPEEGGVKRFTQLFLNAEDAPPQNSDEYVGALVLAFGGNSPEDFVGIETAFEFLLGSLRGNSNGDNS